ncbi:MAG TPA: tRNA (guanosine(46)-N7)-methyltransferase TrmB [Planctomycetota bacterium]|nr:tRNA (guanosine(46)-N7)-methyltransferase TrmB [Planctomycetota bacterium]
MSGTGRRGDGATGGGTATRGRSDAETRGEDTPGKPFEFPNIIEPPPVELKAPVDWSVIFGRSAPLLIEIGCGGGRTVIGLSIKHPELNCIGCERAGEYYRLLRQRATKRALPNLKVTRTDAAVLLEKFLPDACVREYHIYFPDPWPKKKHHKRRLLTDAFCAQLRRTLEPAGTLYFATDHKEYFDEVLPRLEKVFSIEPLAGPWPDAPEGRTNFEVKYIKQGRPIWRLIAKQK